MQLHSIQIRLASRLISTLCSQLWMLLTRLTRLMQITGRLSVSQRLRLWLRLLPSASISVGIMHTLLTRQLLMVFRRSLVKHRLLLISCSLRISCILLPTSIPLQKRLFRPISLSGMRLATRLTRRVRSTSSHSIPPLQA